MPNFNITTAVTTAQSLGVNDGGIVASTGSLSTLGTAVTVSGNNDILVSGSIDAIGSGIAGSGGAVSQFELVVAQSGSIASGFTAVNVAVNQNSFVVNNGAITSTSTALSLTTISGTPGVVTHDLVNTGSITSGARAVTLQASGGGIIEIINTGTITGTGGGILNTTTAGFTTFENSGTLIGSLTSFAYDSSGDHGDTIINTGTIIGLVDLGPGTDSFNSRQGVIEGQVNGGTGNDTIITNDSDDRVNGEEDNDRIQTYGGDDYIQGGDGNDNIFAGDGDDEVIAGAGNDIVRGGLGDDDLNGGAGRDQIRGGSGNDTILGGRNGDTLSGGAGEDVFVYTNTNQSVLADRDTITDFMKGADLIDVSTFGASFIGTAGFSGTGGAELRYGTGGGLTRFEVDANGDGISDMRVDMGAIGALSVDDFIL